MSRRFLALLLAALLLLTACARQEAPEREETGFLFYDPAESPFGADGVLRTAAPDALPETPQAVVAAYLASAPPDGADAPVPDAWTLHAVSQESDTLLVSFSGSPVSALERSLSCCCLAKTLLQLDGVRRVSITDPSGEAARVFADGDIQLTDTGMLPQQETVTLYLPDEQLRYLNRETRTVEAMAASEKPRFIVEQLLSSACIPAGTRLLNISVENGICTVDLSSEFSEGLQGGFSAERMTVYALVDSLTELSEISSVDFWVAGAPVQTLHRMDLTRGVTRDESLIAPVSEEGLLDALRLLRFDRRAAARSDAFDAGRRPVAGRDGAHRAAEYAREERHPLVHSGRDEAAFHPHGGQQLCRRPDGGIRRRLPGRGVSDARGARGGRHALQAARRLRRGDPR